MNIAFVGIQGFPRGLAAVRKQLLISRAINESGGNTTVICNRGAHNKSSAPLKTGICKGVSYKYTSLVTYRPENIILRKLHKFYGSIRESVYLINNRYDAILVGTRSFRRILKYYLISFITDSNLFLLVHEDPKALSNNHSIFAYINGFLFYKFILNIVDGCFPISHYLENKVKRYNPDLPTMIIPALVDLDIFDYEEDKIDEKYFLYCGAASYWEIVYFIIDAFNSINNDDYCLFLVVNGREQFLGKIDEKIKKSPKKHLIRTFGYLDYEELVRLYKNAAGLLIPLREDVRDIARFPHKIGEYTASARPVISTNIGEVREYFTHKENALLSNKYDITEFSDLLKFVIKHPKKSIKIGNKGKQLCEKSFDYKLHGNRIVSFVENQI